MLFLWGVTRVLGESLQGQRWKDELQFVSACSSILDGFPTSGISPVTCPCWTPSHPGRRYWARAGHTTPSAASRDKLLDVPEQLDSAVEGWERKRRKTDPAAAETLWDPWTFVPLLPPSPPLLLLLFSVCQPSNACSPAPAGCLALCPSTLPLDMERYPSLGVHRWLHSYLQDATASWPPIP